MKKQRVTSAQRRQVVRQGAVACLVRLQDWLFLPHPNSCFSSIDYCIRPPKSTPCSGNRRRSCIKNGGDQQLRLSWLDDEVWCPCCPVGFHQEKKGTGPRTVFFDTRPMRHSLEEMRVRVAKTTDEAMTFFLLFLFLFFPFLQKSLIEHLGTNLLLSHLHHRCQGVFIEWRLPQLRQDDHDGRQGR